MKYLLLLIPVFIYLPSVGQHRNVEGLITVNGVKLYCREMGKGEPIVVVHGGPGLDEGYFHPWIDSLSKQYRLITYDQRGTGRSEGTQDTLRLTVDQYIEDLEGLRRTLRVEKMHLMGHSYGGLLSLLYASKYPEHLLSLILIGSGAKDSTPIKTGDDRQTAEDKETINKMVAAGYFNTREGRSKLFPLLWKPYVYNKEHAALIETSLCDSFLLVHNHVKETLKKSALYSNLNERLSQLSIPSLILHGDYELVPLAFAETNHKVLKNSQLVILKECGHFPFIEQQDAFLKIVFDFLQSIPN
jgi:proline iminopeptidase